MKKFSKVISIVLGFVMICTMLVYAETELPADELLRLGIIEGDNNGGIRTDDMITRAEVAKLACRLMGISVVENAETEFSDVTAEHWASGYINSAKGVGVINGDGDGRFRPDDNITYAETIKILMTLTGYESFAKETGGYPNGYIKMASMYGLLEDVDFVFDENAIRKDVLELAVKALDFPIAEQTVYGAEPEYVIMDGKSEAAPLVTLRIRSGFSAE